MRVCHAHKARRVFQILDFKLNVPSANRLQTNIWEHKYMPVEKSNNIFTLIHSLARKVTHLDKQDRKAIQYNQQEVH